MKLSDYLMDFGRVVAYYPNLKKVTGSTTATILLCQLMYCHKKQLSNLKESEVTAQDKWVKKNIRELTWETGLTYNEQKGARKQLRELGLLREQRVLRQSANYYRIDFDRLNELWDIAMTKPEEVIPEFDDDKVNSGHETNSDGKKSESDKENKYEETGRKLSAVRNKIENKLNLIAQGKRWDNFVEFALIREERYNESVEVYLDWAIREGFDPIYWTPEKMKTTYPRAFMNSSSNSGKSFVAQLPKLEKKEPAPMPKDLKKQKSLY